MNTNRRSQKPVREKKDQSEQPIPFHRRGLSEDVQRQVTHANNTNEDQETENSFYYVSTARQDKKIYKSKREVKHQEDK